LVFFDNLKQDISKMKNIFFKISLVAVVMFGSMSCENSLNIDPPTSLDASTGFKTRQDVEAAMNGCYSSIQSANYMGIRYNIFADLTADNLSHVGTFPSFSQIVNRIITPDNAEIVNMWTNVYSGINRMNNVITSAPKVDDKAFVANTAVGEARALRAFQHFNLLRFFGGGETGFGKTGGVGIPISTTVVATAADAVVVPRAAEADVWNAIIDDLDFASKNIPAATNKAASTGRIGKWGAFALKSRAHLYRGDWALAEATADSVITKGGYTMLKGADYGNLYLSKNSSEAIWELQFDPTNIGQVAFFYYTTARGGRNEVSSSNALRDAHEAGDVRKVINFAPKDTAVVTSTVPVGKPIKFTRVDGTDNQILIRLAEMYLIRAEARAQQSNLTGAIADINLIRNRAGLANTTAATQAELIIAIEKERRVELAHEGHRWFDLRRYNRLSTLPSFTQTFRALWPIPQREVTNGGGKIIQNTGY
jgi:starch-binding outer membrane protein, SusD/RagB family